MTGSGATVSVDLSAEHIPVVTMQDCAATSSYKHIESTVAVRCRGHDDRLTLPIQFRMDRLSFVVCMGCVPKT